MPDGNTRRTDVASRLRAAREKAGLSQGQVAKMLGLHRPTISEIEAGRRKISAEELSELAKAYDVSVSWLADGEAEVRDPAIELAARELVKLKKKDLDNLMDLLRTLRKAEN